jgi:uncharacterized protein involved in exopolysaccharide biosynthesis
MEQAKFYLQEFLFLFFFKIYIILIIPFVIFSLTAVYVFSAKPLYVASSSILLKPFFDSRDLLSQSGFLNVSPVTQIDINTEIEILNSRELAIEVANELEIKPVKKKDSLKVRLGVSSKTTPEDEIINFITEGLNIYSIVMSSVIRVQKTGEDPVVITDIVNKYIDTYTEKRIFIHRSNNDMHLYEDDIQKKRDSLEKKRYELQEFIKNNNILHIEAQKQNNITLEKELKGELYRIENDIIEKNRSIEKIKDKNGGAMIKEFRESQFIATIRSAYIPLLQKKDNISSLYKENSPEFAEIMNEINNIDKEVKKEMKKIIDGFVIEVGSLEMKINNIKRKINKLNEDSLRISMLEVEYDKRKEEIGRLSYIYDLYAKKFEEERIQARKDKQGVSNIAIISKAYPPSRPVLPKRTFMLAISIIVGSLAGLAAGFVAYYFDHTVKNHNDIIGVTNSPVISTLEFVAGK